MSNYALADGRHGSSTATVLSALAAFLAFVGVANRRPLTALVMLVYVIGAGVVGRTARELSLRRPLLFPTRAESHAVLDAFVGIGILIAVNQVLVLMQASPTARRLAIVALVAGFGAAHLRVQRRPSGRHSASVRESADLRRAVIGIVGSAAAGFGVLILEPLVCLVGVAVLLASRSNRVRAMATLPTALGTAIALGLGTAQLTGPLASGIADGQYVAAIAQAISAYTPLHHPFASGATYSYHSLGYLVVGLFTEVGGLDPVFAIHTATPALATLCTVALLWDLAQMSAFRATLSEKVVPLVVGLTAVSGVIWTNSLTQLLSYPLLVLAAGLAVTQERTVSTAEITTRVLVVAGLIGVKGPIGIAVAAAFAAQLITRRGRVGWGDRWRSAAFVTGGAMFAYAAFFGIGELSGESVVFRPRFLMFGFMAQSEFVADGRVAKWAGMLALLAISVVATTGVAIRAQTDRGADDAEAVRAAYRASGRTTDDQHVEFSAGRSVWFAVALLGCVTPYVLVREVSPPVTISTYFLLHAVLIAWVAAMYDTSPMAVLARLPNGTWIVLVLAGIAGQAAIVRIESALASVAVAARILRAGSSIWVALVASLVLGLTRTRRASALSVFVVVAGLLSTGAFLHARGADLAQSRPIAADDRLPDRYEVITKYFADTGRRGTIIATNRVCEPSELSCSPDGDPLISLAARRQMYIEGTGHVTTVSPEGSVARWVNERVELSRAMVMGDGAVACRSLAASGVTHYVLDVRVTPVLRLAPCLVLDVQSEEFQIFHLK